MAVSSADVDDLIIPERNPCKIYVGNLPFATKVYIIALDTRVP